MEPLGLALEGTSRGSAGIQQVPAEQWVQEKGDDMGKPSRVRAHRAEVPTRKTSGVE